MANFRAIVEYYAGEEAEEFAEWAFGRNFKAIPGNEIWRNWNELHGDKLILEGSGKPLDDIAKMIEIWKRYKIAKYNPDHILTNKSTHYPNG